MIKNGIILKQVKLYLGEELYFFYRGVPKIVRLVKVTRRGYNLLLVEENSCILYRHLYPVRRKKTEPEMRFIVPEYLAERIEVGKHVFWKSKSI